MSKDVQLKESEIVGNDVVLSDIFPKTETPAINDPSSGQQLAVVLSDLWNSINNALTRIVNSVNNKTGVVVLDANDIGLGNVDNISFADIKKWVIQRIQEEFGNKRLKLFNNKAELDNMISENDLNNANSAFFVENWTLQDSRSYIGYIYVNDEDHLAYNDKYINTIGQTDSSITYDKGNIRVNISSYEDALKVYSDFSTPEENGLYIDKTKIAGTIHFYHCIYGDGTGSGETALLRLKNEIDASYPLTRIYINDNMITSNYFAKLNAVSLHKNDIIICNMVTPPSQYTLLTSQPQDWITNWCDYYEKTGNTYKLLRGTISTPFEPDKYYKINTNLSNLYDINLINYNTAIGYISSYPESPSSTNPVIIKFYTIEMRDGDGTSTNKSPNYTDDTRRPGRLDVTFATGSQPYSWYDKTNISGLKTTYRNSITDFKNNSEIEDLYNAHDRNTVTPIGTTEIITNGFKETITEGLRIMPDLSLNVSNYNGWHTILNTSSRGSHTGQNFIAPFPIESSLGNTKDFSYIGINLTKCWKNFSISGGPGTYELINASGMRILNSYELNTNCSNLNSIAKLYELFNLDPTEDYPSGWNKVQCYYKEADTGELYYDSDYQNQITPTKYICYQNLGTTGAKYYYYDGTTIDEYNPFDEVYMDFGSEAMTTQPDDWSTNYTLYYTFNAESGRYEHIEHESEPPTFESGKYYKPYAAFSGGLLINPGRFLCIEPGITPKDWTDYYDSGKVCVRVDNKSIADNGHNRLSVKCDPDGGVAITNNGIYVTLAGCLGHSSDPATHGCIILKLDPDSALEIDPLNHLTINIDKLKEQLGLS